MSNAFYSPYDAAATLFPNITTLAHAVTVEPYTPATGIFSAVVRVLRGHAEVIAGAPAHLLPRRADHGAPGRSEVVAANAVAVAVAAVGLMDARRTRHRTRIVNAGVGGGVASAVAGKLLFFGGGGGGRVRAAMLRILFCGYHPPTHTQLSRLCEAHGQGLKAKAFRLRRGGGEGWG